MKFQNGILLSPDSYTFIPKHSHKQNTVTLTLSELGFKKVIEAIELFKAQEQTPEVGLGYHPVLSNCAAFARTIRDIALPIEGTKINDLQNHQFSIIKNARFKVVEKVAAVAFPLFHPITSPPQQEERTPHLFKHENQESFYLPAHLLFDRSKPDVI